MKTSSLYHSLMLPRRNRVSSENTWRGTICFQEKAVFNFPNKNRSRDFALDLKYSMHVHMNRIYAKALKRYGL